ncbi:hypothetical protein QF038_000476 [Pseudarthrobacter sp. W1I19]|uniref:hypothetical protein n=1 Tax=Pseudarthrobacter sp. W1I19 TaxID=3042288 RepID=UPI002789D30B|nr:hypothetical protein [Pseudarthrobacter sp. W1I19]MDQ0921968.1 hypothetical protein [Pseudarthrobacter sp. W1I19]
MQPSKTAKLQGTFYIINGLWPLVHMRSFEAVSGPKADKWLVRTVSGLLIAIGLEQVRATPDRESAAVARRLGIGAAVTLAAIDLYYALSGRISRVYLFDATVELFWIRAWLGKDLAAGRGKVPLDRSTQSA